MFFHRVSRCVNNILLLNDQMINISITLAAHSCTVFVAVRLYFVFRGLYVNGFYNLLFNMASKVTITRAMIHEFILKEANSISTTQKKEMVLNYVLNILKIDCHDINLQDTINIVKKKLNTSFFNRLYFNIT